ncbi:rubrerythrin family protein [Velocimicrobium porci]|uniref:Rubrerythrin family protein n=1 Tax=Velocimicrobium porci TaxID=2606634 RepID=A0A6L5XZ82_9FIRM|nr:rubrerythrin family protein [Velocimicrobium porci]MSS64186.1 rubrerythrin family protein [Velocimicrobium porci]
MEFRNSRTYKNLMKAFEGELKASTKYRLYGENAKKEGYQQIGNIFDMTAKNEQEHAEIWYKLMNSGKVPSTLCNLVESYESEIYEWTEMYENYARIAEQEGYQDIADLFRMVGEIEHHHDYRFEVLADNIRHGTVFCKNKQIIWVCLNCGNTYYGECAPEVCPVCGYPKGYYEMYCENY